MNLNRDLKFTVILPTRERADTLRWSLKTCVTQDYDNFEILVSDNVSQDNTREVIAEYSDSRIRYINPGRRMSMAEHYDFAVSHATGDFVSIIGDDDGLMPNAISELSELLRENDSQAVSWQKPVYFWPDFADQKVRNVLRAKLRTTTREYNSVDALAHVLKFDPASGLNFNDLACLYHGFVRVDLINKLRLPAGRFFDSMSADVYAALLITSHTETFLYSGVPFSIHGISNHSNGFPSGDTRSQKLFLAEGFINPHPKVPVVPTSVPICTGESFLKILGHYPETRTFHFEIKDMLRKTLSEAVPLEAANHEPIAAAAGEIARAFDLVPFYHELLRQYPNRPATARRENTGYNFFSHQLSIKLDDSVKNVYDATLAQKEILESQRSLYIGEAIEFLMNSVKHDGLGRSVNRGIRRILGLPASS